MRISIEKLNLFKNLFTKEYKDIKLFLFGSRVDESKRGGDIDILILSNKKIDRSYIRFVKREFYKKFGDQKIDIVNNSLFNT